MSRDPRDLDDVRFRRPIDADHPVVMAQVDDWWGGRRVRAMLPRLWFQHFAGTSWIAEGEDGRLLGFLVGFISPDHPEVAARGAWSGAGSGRHSQPREEEPSWPSSP